MKDIKNSLISGQKAQKFRKHLAMSSASASVKKNKTSILTYKFRLDLNENMSEIQDRIPKFSDYIKLYNKIEGVEPGTLTHYLCTFVLAGFRLFSNAKSAFEFIKSQNNPCLEHLSSHKLLKSSAVAFDLTADLAISEPGYEPYLAIARILERYTDPDKKINSFVKDNFTTYNNNALSWLLGKGHKFFKESTAQEIALCYGIPDDKYDCAKAIKNAADKLEFNSSLFSNDMRLSQFRSCFGGHIDSWATNYIKRLLELEKIIANISYEIKIPKAFISSSNDFLTHCNLNRSDIEELISNIKSSSTITDVKDALSRLLGHNQGASSADIKAIRDYSELINRLCAYKEQIFNTIDQAAEDKNSLWHDIKRQTKDELQTWEKLEKLPKLNDLSGGVPQAENELNAKLTQLKLVTQAQNNHFAKIMQWVHSNIKDFSPFNHIVQTEQAKLDNRPKENTTACDLAVRMFLHKIGRIAREDNNNLCKELQQWFLDNKVFDNKTDFNKYFHNKLGSIYISPYSTQKNAGYKINKEVLNFGEKIVLLFTDKLQEINKRYEGNSIAEKSELNSLLKLNYFYYNFFISGINKVVPVSIVKPLLSDDMLEQSLSATHKIRLKSNEVDPSTLSSIFNIYKSLISGCYTVLNRETFFLRTKFSWIENFTLFYVPKADASWIMPERYLKNTRWQQYIEEEVLVFENDKYKVDITQTFNNICSAPADYAELLVQLPHDWFYQLPYECAKEDNYVQALAICKDKGFPKQSRLNTHISGRLIGPSSFKSKLDSVLIYNGDVTISDMTLLVEQRVSQQLKPDESLELKKYDPEFTLAIPINDARSQSTNYSFKHIIAIDQGEIGPSYAVFNLSDAGNANAEPIATGSIRIPSIRRLIKSVSSFRKKKSTTQKFNQRFDSTMFNIRENVTGDICSVIVGLMQKYNAFPVLEREVSNLESGSKQLSLVYKAVNSMFLYSDVEMQNTNRKSWWKNADHWQTNILRLIRGENKTSKSVKLNGQNYKELKIYPGVSVSAYMTSRICSCCGRNIFELIKNDELEDKHKKYQVNAQGEINIRGEVIKLYQKSDSHKTLVPGLKSKKTYNAINQRAPMVTPYPEGIICLLYTSDAADEL